MIQLAMVNFLCLAFLLAVPSRGLATAETRIVYASANIRIEKGSFFKTSTSHLFTCRLDGSDPHQLTFGPKDDCDPTYDREAKLIRFTRRSPLDLVNASESCSIHLDGSGFQSKVLTDENEEPTDGVADSNKPALPGIPSKAGGTSMPICVADLGGGLSVYGFFWEPASLMGIARKGDRKPRLLKLFARQNHRRVPVDVFISGKEANEWGSTGFWLAGQHRQILLQQVASDEEGGVGHIYLINIKTGEVSMKLDNEFLEDASARTTEFLTSSWNWGNGFGKDGAVPRSVLRLRRPDASKSITTVDQTVTGACFAEGN